MHIPPIDSVIALLGPQAELRTATNWVTGRQGLVYFVNDPASGRRSVFKWLSSLEMAVARDLLPDSPMNTPMLYRWWDATADHPAAVEMEWIPHLASPAATFRFSPTMVPITDELWLGSRLDELFSQLGAMHAVYQDGKGLGDYTGQFRTETPESDRQRWETDMRKLHAVRNLPDADHWIGFWEKRENLLMDVLQAAYSYPRSWIWGDTKWDHVGCRENGEVVTLEWSPVLGLPGNDLYLLLFLPPTRQRALLQVYLKSVQQYDGDAHMQAEAVRWGLLRTCYLYGPGQACLSLRGFSEGGSTAADRAAWAVDAQTTANALLRIEKKWLI